MNYIILISIPDLRFESKDIQYAEEHSRGNNGV